MKERKTSIRTLIVDDEPPARDLIATLLAEESDIEVVQQCANGQEAVAAIERLKPDLIFLDVQMPGLDGFEVLAQVSPDRLPYVIFVTAFNQYAVRAFEVHALDYILKPFEYDRLRQAVQRAREQLTQNADNPAPRLMALLEDMRLQGQSWSRIPVRESGRVLFLKPSEVNWVEAEGNYVRLHCGQKSFLLRETMNSAEARLASKKFLRVSRSTLVNLERIVEWQPLFHGDSAIILEGGTRLTMSRVYRDSFERLMAQLE